MDGEELSRERCVSSEPCSTRPNPFDDNDQSSRKRQRISRGGSRSRSVDAARASDITESMPPREETTEEMPTDPPSPPPSTPPPKALEHLPSEPTSSRVTINLRTAQPLDPIPSSPPSPSTPSKMINDGEDTGAGVSVESESDVLSTVPAVDTPSSSPSAVGSPQIELVVSEDDQDFGKGSPPVAIIGEDEIFQDPMQTFPYAQDGEPLAATAKRLSTFIQYEPIEDEKCFVDIRDWIESYLQYTSSHPDGWYEYYSKHREFWLVLPEVVWALSWRSRFFGTFMSKSRDGRAALSEFLVQFARLTGRFVAMDVRTLSLQHKADSDQEPDLASRGYLQAFGFLLRKHESSHIGRNLENHYNWDWNDDILMLMNSFQAEGGTLSALAKLVRGQLGMMPRNPKIIIECLIDPCRIARKIVDDAAAILDDSNVLHRQYAEDAKQSMVQGFDFFQAMSGGLESIIEKHYTFLTPDSAYNHIESLWMIFRHTLSWENDATRELLERRHRERPELSFRLLPRVISCDWKFRILKKLICSTQMQLRVVGVTRMCGDLLEIYNGSKIPDPPSNPLLLYFAEFILNHKLVDYLVGTGSHPEIINESNNIVGFLIVTKTYKDQQSDKIWQTVISSQDPRVVEAILKMLCKCLGLMDYQSLLYLCKKARSLPIEGFTTAAREFCHQLFNELVRKALNESAQPVDSPPYEMCVRLIRQSSIITPECPAGYPDVQNFAAGRFRDLLGHGPNPEARSDIYRSCIEDITAGTPTAPGSICVINALLRQNIGTDLHTLTTEHGLTKLVVEELQSTILGDRLLSNPSIRNSPASLARRELLLTIIINEPGTISPDLGAQLWSLLVGSESKSITDRNTSWQILNSAVKKSAPNNVFIASCFRDYLPKLPPDCFTIGALDFTREAISSWLEEVRHDFIEEDRVFESPALEQLWRMIVTAPPNTIDAPAINILVEVYLESQLIISIPRTKARSIHLTLVDRCLKELAAAATKLKTFNGSNAKLDDEAMVLVASEDEFSEQEKIFARSLAVLREFLKAYQMKPRFASPKSKSPFGTTQNSVKGEPLTVKYQSFDGDKHTEVKSLTLGKLNNATSLIASLQKATGFTNYKVYYGGKLFDPDESDISKSLEDLNLNGLFLVQRREDTEGHLQDNKTSLEFEITKHFEELWGYLAMHEKVAQEIYYFLVKFPVYDRLLNDIASETTSHSKIFPVGQPFKSLYAIYALRECITTQSQKGNLSDESLTRAIVLIIAAISDRDVINQCPSDELRDCLALHFIDCLVQFLNLKETALPTAVSPFLNDALLQRLLELLDGAKSAATTPNSVYLTGRSFEAMLDACIHSPELWTIFKLHLSNSPLLRELLLDDPRPLIRKNVMKQILGKCAFSPSLAQVSTTEFTVAFWPMAATLIPYAMKQPQRCEETFTLSHQLFKKLAETSIDFLNLDELIGQWSALLLSHTPYESVGHPENPDAISLGLAQLLFCVASFAKASQQALSASTIGLDLLRELLFPELSAGEVITPRIPVLNTLTRHLLSETIWFLVKDDEQQYKKILLYLSHLVPYEDKFDELPYAYELPFLFERSKAIRSHTGYVGLRNLSNTCYLNSLFTQLFMNIPFREFMLTANVADRGSQKLLAETQSLFSYMQNSLKRFVDPAILASSIRTYEETQIDVSIQMDVDEFYNLLFDRWEGQILSAEAKKQFRSFYGGQLVQQVKSKECSHISERLEPFSAIQCDIKGKSCLQESLQAYVDGEIMEGDNKYKCSTCDRHVDAVKRACLKDVPDNLIFHLKRFDFNLRTLTRSKINDYFSFPTKIDMRPYKVEHLSDSSEESPEDMFELVGVLVHSGTAESGHYYSYVRERPSNGDKENWVEFNDDLVTNWDSSCLEGACFGGIDYRGTLDSGNIQYDKTYSAYMLFYQRSSVLALQKQTLEAKGLRSPIRLEISSEFAKHIAGENELLMRKYCLYDPSHASFVTKMLGNIKVINKGTCAADHVLEKSALTTALNHMDQVFARTKDLPDFPTFMLTLRQLCHSCAECSRDFLEWFCDCPEALRHQLLRNPDSQVRSEIANSILSALSKVKVEAAYAYGFGDDESSDDGVEEEAGPPRVIQRVVTAIHKLWDMFEKNCRAWPEYFGLLANIASMGVHEAVLLLDMGFLRKSLDILSADPLLPMAPQYTRMLNIISKRIVNRPVSFDGVILLLCRLIQVCDASIDSIPDDQERLDTSLNGGSVALTIPERHLLMQHWTRGQSHILVEKLLRINQNYPATRMIIVRLLHWPESVEPYIYYAITHGIRKGSTDVPCGPFLRAAVLYCEQSEAPRAILNMVNYVTKVASELDNTEGREFLQFFKDVFDLRSNRVNIPDEEIHKFCLEKIPHWAPALLTYYEPIVRQETEDFVTDIILRHPPAVEFGTEENEAAKARNITQVAQRLGITCLEYLQDTYIHNRAQAVRSNLLSIHSVIESCAGFFDEDGKEESTRRFFALRSSVIPKLKQYTVEEADEEVSDWDGSEEEYGSSEPMDSLTELCDTDVQL